MGHVQTALAKAYMKLGQHQAAAAAYARSDTRFETAVIAVMQCGDKLALQAFLTEKLSQLQPHHKPQRVLLATWKLEVMLDRLSLLHGACCCLLPVNICITACPLRSLRPAECLHGCGGHRGGLAGRCTRLPV